jgi:hypothetical protein
MPFEQRLCLAELGQYLVVGNACPRQLCVAGRYADAAFASTD